MDIAPPVARVPKYFSPLSLTPKIFVFSASQPSTFIAASVPDALKITPIVFIHFSDVFCKIFG
jgi:hypothetical protein